MNVVEQSALAQSLRLYIIDNCPFLPVRGGAFSLDGLLPEGESMSLQLNGGRKLREYINGSRRMRQPFTIFYRGPVTGDNGVKSAMIGLLNALGRWMEQAPPPRLGDWLTVSVLEQVETAGIADRSGASITYQAGYALGYTTKGTR